MASFSAEKKEIEKYCTHLDASMKAGIRSALKAGVGLGSFWFTIFIAYAVGFFFGGFAIRHYW